MPANFIWGFADTITTRLSTELNSLAAGAVCTVSAAITGNIDQYAMVELFVNFGTAPTDGRSVILYVVPQIDGTNYSDATDPLEPGNILCVFRIRGVTGNQRIVKRTAMLPPGDFKFCVKNDTDQAMAASGNTIKTMRYDEQY